MPPPCWGTAGGGGAASGEEGEAGCVRCCGSDERYDVRGSPRLPRHPLHLRAAGRQAAAAKPAARSRRFLPRRAGGPTGATANLAYPGGASGAAG